MRSSPPTVLLHKASETQRVSTKELEKERLILQHMLPVRASCQPTLLSAPLAGSSSSSSISRRSSARRLFSAWVKSTSPPPPFTSYCITQHL